MLIVFWASILFIIYTYIGYPLLIYLLKKDNSTKTSTENNLNISDLFVSIVLVVKNEEKHIKKKVNNLLSQTKNILIGELIVVSDSSVDKTDSIVKELNLLDNRIKLYRLSDEKGKAAGINKGVDEAKYNIIVFADARQEFEKDAVYKLLQGFENENVGAVAGELRFKKINETGNVAQVLGAYWKYETWLRKNESNYSTVTGVPGAIYAVRKELITKLPNGLILDDVWIPMNVIMQNKYVKYKEDAIAWDYINKESNKEYKRKIRTLAGNVQLLVLNPKFISPVKNKYWWMFLSHKIFRLFVPICMITLFISNAYIDQTFYKIIFVGQILFYSLGIVGWIIQMIKHTENLCAICNYIFTFISLNIAALLGVFIYFTGKYKSSWK